MTTNPKIQTRNTKQKEIILYVLRSMKTHPTADEIYFEVRKQLPNISLGTVYRNLDNLTKSGQITKLFVSGEVKNFDGNTSYHHHIQCQNCGSICDVRYFLQEDINEIAGQQSGYKVLEHTINFKGICPKCLE